MSTITPSMASYHNVVPQQLYTIEDPLQNDVSQFVAGSNTAVVTFDTSDVEHGSDITVTGEIGEIFIQGGITYQFTARIDTNSKVPVSIRLQQKGSDVVYGAPARAGQTLTAFVTVPAREDNTVEIVAYTEDGSRFEYPATISNAFLAVQAVYGYTVA